MGWELSLSLGAEKAPGVRVQGEYEGGLGCGLLSLNDLGLEGGQWGQVWVCWTDWEGVEGS